MVNNVDLIPMGPQESVLTFNYQYAIFAFLGMVSLRPNIKVTQWLLGQHRRGCAVSHPLCSLWSHFMLGMDRTISQVVSILVCEFRSPASFLPCGCWILKEARGMGELEGMGTNIY